MTPETLETVWLDEHHECTTIEIMELSGVTEDELNELVDCGVLSPIDPNTTPWRFSASCLAVARELHRLRGDFEIAPEDLALFAKLLERIRDLETEVRGLRARLPEWPG